MLFVLIFVVFATRDSTKYNRTGHSYVRMLKYFRRMARSFFDRPQSGRGHLHGSFDGEFFFHLRKKININRSRTLSLKNIFPSPKEKIKGKKKKKYKTQKDK